MNEWCDIFCENLGSLFFLRVGTQGIRVDYAGYGATLLTEVIPELGWNQEEAVGFELFFFECFLIELF
jgi:AMMECR1 domain-containing protein